MLPETDLAFEQAIETRDGTATRAAYAAALSEVIKDHDPDAASSSRIRPEDEEAALEAMLAFEENFGEHADFKHALSVARRIGNITGRSTFKSEICRFFGQHGADTGFQLLVEIAFREGYARAWLERGGQISGIGRVQKVPGATGRASGVKPARRRKSRRKRRRR